MSDMRDILLNTASRVLGAGAGVARAEALAAGHFPADLWSELESAGLAQMCVIGQDFDLGDIMAVVRRVGYLAAPVPLADTLLAQWLLAEAGLDPAEGPLAVGPAFPLDALTVDEIAHGPVLNGTLRAVPFGRDCLNLVAIASRGDTPVLVILPLSMATECIEGRDLAEQPRDCFTFDAVPLAADQIHACPPALNREVLMRRGALLRCAAMSGAIARVLDLSVRYASERQQFGRPIGKFQAVQQLMAQLAGASAIATAAAEAAAAGVERGNGAFEVAAAKARIGEAATMATQIGHQVHGAMGFTREHELHLVTRLLWVWREEYGSESYWHHRLGLTAASLGGKALWATIVQPDGLGLEGDV